MLKRALFIAILAACATCPAQQAQPTAPAQPDDKPQVKVNYLNVCTPGKEEQEILNGAMAFVQGKPAFSSDFEVSRGRTTLKDAPDSKYVRLRRDMAPESPLMTAQYSMSTDATNTIEILVLRPRDPKDFLEIIVEDRVSSSAAAPASILAADTPVTRLRINRLGKSSAVVTRCPDVDQSAYEPLFQQATDVMAKYRAALGLRTAFRSDIGWLESTSNDNGTKTGQTKGASAPAKKKQPPTPKP